MKSTTTIFKQLIYELKKDNSNKIIYTFKALDKVKKHYKSKTLPIVIKKVKIYITKQDMSNLAKLYSTIILKLNERHKTKAHRPKSKMKMKCYREGTKKHKLKRRKTKRKNKRQKIKTKRYYVPTNTENNYLIPASPIINYTKPVATPHQISNSPMTSYTKQMPIILPPPTLKNEKSPVILGLTAIAFIIILYIISLMKQIKIP